MISPYAELSRWFASLDEDTVVLTPNKRLSRFLQQEYARFQQRRGNAAWTTLPCYPLHGWSQSLWEQLQRRGHAGTDRVLLSDAQENLLWEQIIRQHDRGLELLNPRQTAGVVMDAWHTLLQWGLDPARIAGRQKDKRAFKLWTEQYQTICRERGLTDGGQILETLHEAVAEKLLPLPKAIALYAFDVITPMQRALLDRCSGQGVTVYPVNVVKTSRCRRVELDDENAEITVAARWAAESLASRDGVEAPRIGIVVPQLAGLRGKVERLFNDVFAPQTLRVSHPRQVPGFNLSAAQPLGRTPLIQSALDALQLNRPELGMDLAGRILRSPFIGKLEELPRRALLDADLRSTATVLRPSRLRAAVGAVRSVPAGARVASCPDLFRRLQNFHHLERNARDRRTPGAWAGVFDEQLTALGWPGERGLDTLEYQQLRHWREVMESLAGLDRVCGPCDAMTALGYLAELAMQTPFHARTAESPVQILGLLEAAGMLFDRLWVMQMDGVNWPRAPDPNPLIPIRLQVELGMPGASAQKELQFARALTHRLAAAADQVLFSHGRYQGDQELKPSPLIEDYTPISIEQLPLITPVSYARELFQSAALTADVDQGGPPVTGPGAVRGGTQILRDQAACPFRAYAWHRLQAREIEPARPGVSAAEHGVLLHQALEIIWRELGGQAELLLAPDATLDTLIDRAIAGSLLRMPADRKPGQRLRDLEAGRLRALIRAWLELEKRRSPFTVAFNESERDLTLAGLPLRVRYDRVDEQENGGLFVIDYKTGRADIGGWTGSRPDEPQVPIYCLANERRITGAAFGVLSVKEIGFKGIGASGAVAPGVVTPEAAGYPDLPDNWPGILRQWRAVLERLAADFIAGKAAVDPKSTADSCRHCALPGLCRVRETAAGDGHQRQEAADAG
jgi:probable DNA repair protein